MSAKEAIECFVSGIGSVVMPLRPQPPREPRRERSISRHFEKAGARIARSIRTEAAHVSR